MSTSTAVERPHADAHPTRPPGPRGWPLLGSSFAFARAPLPFLLHLARDYGPITYVRFGSLPTYVVNEPELIEQLLLGRHRECIKDKYTRDLMPLAGRGLVTSEGELWQRQRRLAAPPLQARRISNYAETMLSITQRLCARVIDGEVRDARADFTELTLEIASKTLLGADTLAQAEQVGHAVETFMDFYERQMYSLEGMLPLSVPTPARMRMRRAVVGLDAVIGEVIARCRREGIDEDHVLARLVRSRADDGSAMDARQLRDEAVTMLAAGHETTALALTFAVYLLARHPAIADRLRVELDANRSAPGKSLAARAATPYLTAVIRETLRLYPPAYMIGREVVTPFELGGFPLPRGSQLTVSPFALHREPRFFPEPERFMPERWLDPAIHDLPKFAYLPFGAGPRVCIGNHFAMLAIGLVLGEFIEQFEFELLASFELRLKPLVTLRPAGRVPLRLHRRHG
jgi:cytochrome P450